MNADRVRFHRNGLIQVDQGTHQGANGLFDVTYNPDDSLYYVHPHGSLEVLGTYGSKTTALAALASLSMPAVIEWDPRPRGAWKGTWPSGALAPVLHQEAS